MDGVNTVFGVMNGTDKSEVLRSLVDNTDILMNLTNATRPSPWHNSNGTTALEARGSSVVEIINIMTIVSTMVPILCIAFALWMVFMCQKLPGHLKYTSISFLLSNLLFFLTVLLFRLLIYGFNMKHAILQSGQFISSGIFSAISGATVTLMSVDRLIAVQWPFLYKRFVTDRVIISSLCVGWLGIMSTMLSAWLPAHTYLLGSGESMLFISRRINVATVLTFPILTILASSVLLYRLKTDKGEWLQKKAHRVTRILVMIIMTHTFLTMPFVIHFTMLEIKPELTTLAIRKLLHLLVYLCFVANSVFDSFFYTLNIKECKENAFRIFGRKPPTENESC